MEELDETHSNLDFAILQTLHTHGQPIGSGTLHYVLRKGGDNLSAPTIGRKFRDLEHRGLVTKVSVEGRVLTAAGERLLHKLDQERNLESSGDKLLKLLNRSGRKDIIDQLAAPCHRVRNGRAGGGQCHTGADPVSGTTHRTRLGYDRVDHGETGSKADVDFHDTIAEGSGNSILSALVIMLRSQVWLNQVIAAIRTKVGGRLVVDHEAILNAIKTRKPELARRAMGRPLLGTGFRATRKVLIQAPGGRRFGSMRRAWLNCSMALV